MSIQSSLVFAGKLGDLVLDVDDHHKSVDNVVFVMPISRDTIKESGVLAALNNLNIVLADHLIISSYS